MSEREEPALPGWFCPRCQGFNGDAKEVRTACRACDAARPRKIDLAEENGVLRGDLRFARSLLFGFVAAVVVASLMAALHGPETPPVPVIAPECRAQLRVEQDPAWDTASVVFEEVDGGTMSFDGEGWLRVERADRRWYRVWAGPATTKMIGEAMQRWAEKHADAGAVP